MIGLGSARVTTAWTFLVGVAMTTSVGTAGEPPVVHFDLPAVLEAREVVDADLPSSSRLVEVTIPVSVRVATGSVRGVDEVAVEVDGSVAGLMVRDFAPQTTLGSELAGDIQVTTTTEKARTFDASLGGQSPIPIGDVTAQVLPSISTGSKNRTAKTKTTARLAPKKPIVVSGTMNAGRGAFFQLRPSSQTTLEGQQILSVVFAVPDDWTTGTLEVRCWARGERQILWYDQPQVWGSTRRAVQVELTPVEPPRLTARRHVVAKQPTSDDKESWVPMKTVAVESKGDELEKPTESKE